MAELQIWQNGRCIIQEFEPPASLQYLLELSGTVCRHPCGGKGSCGKCAVILEGSVSEPDQAEKLAGTRLSCQARILGDASVYLPGQNKEEIESGTAAIPAGRPMDGKLGAAVDIGTTTLVLRLYDLHTGMLQGQAVMSNPQTSVSADVMGRIGAAVNGQSEKLQTQLTDALELLQKEAGGTADIMVITGNTTMLYLLTGRDPSSLSQAPFEADTLFDTFWGNAYLPPCMNAFVGADISCAVMASKMCERQETALLCDIGTNGEIALWKNGILYVTSTAAGPAFEGAEISCGCNSISGAIDRVWVENGELSYSTISDAPAVGLCGSGLLDAVAALLKLGWMDETGSLGQAERRIAPGVTLSQRDIRAVQLAKAAIAAGISTLLDVSETKCEEISMLYLAGGFGSHLNVESAAAIGLIPKALESRVSILGNAALAGASQLLLDRDCITGMRRIVSCSKHLNLGGNPGFNENYIENMVF